MAEDRSTFTHALLAPRVVKYGALAWLLFAGYDTLCSQFDLPTIGTLMGMSGALMPWWGWLLVLQAIVVYALFEYVRRSQQLPSSPSPSPEALERVEKDLDKLSEHVVPLETNYTAILRDYQNMRGLEARFEEALDGFKEAVRAEDEKRRMHLEVLEGKLETLRERTRSSIHTIWMREQIAEVARDIRRDAADLAHYVSEGMRHDANSWDKWTNVYSHWTNLMIQWWGIARFYIADSRQVLIASDNKYPETQVNESLLVPAGGAEAVRVYKRFRIIQDQWEVAQDALEKNLVMVAFCGMTELDVRHGQAVEQG